MVAPTVGINPLDPMWIATLSVLLPLVPQALPVSVVVQLSRTDCAACDGPASNPGGIVNPVEPLIDMGRTALNVSGSMTLVR